jgi:hypothetical protein
MIVIELSKISGLFNRVYFVKTLKNDIRNSFVFKSICGHLRKSVAIFLIYPACFLGLTYNQDQGHVSLPSFL